MLLVLLTTSGHPVQSRGICGEVNDHSADFGKSDGKGK